MQECMVKVLVETRRLPSGALLPISISIRKIVVKIVSVTRINISAIKKDERYECHASGFDFTLCYNGDWYYVDSLVQIKKFRSKRKKKR